jgi:hypothetical protein
MCAGRKEARAVSESLHDELVTGPPITFAHVGYVGALLLGFFAALSAALDRAFGPEGGESRG